MILGTGYGQLPLIEACKRAGFYSIGVDANNESLGASKVDVFFHVDIKDTKKVLKIAKKESINAAVTMQSDLPVPTIGKINDELSLKGVSNEAAIICSNKDLTRKLLTEKGIKQPKYFVTTCIQDATNAAKQIGFPCIVKSPDSSASRGVTKVKSATEVSSAYEEAYRHSRSKKIIVEEYIEGVEIGAQTFSQNGECIYCFIHNDTVSENGYMVPTGHSYPSNQKSINYSKLKEDIGNALAAIGLDNGPSNIDLIAKKNGDIFIIEIGARIGATCLPELTSIYTGINWVELTIKNALGIKHLPVIIDEQPCAARILEAPGDGYLKEINFLYELDDYSKYNPIIEITARLGDKVSVLRKGTDRIGRIVVEAEDVDQAEHIVNELYEKIEFIVKE